MFEPIVLVTFYSRCGATERLALSAAVGAVQARGLIRMRRISDADADRTIAASPDCRETLVRMHKEYVPPSEQDILNAHAIIVGPPSGTSTASPEWQGFLQLLARLGSDGRIAGKVAAVIDAGDPASVASFSSALLGLGFSAPAPTSPAQKDREAAAVSLGRSVAEAARAIQQTAG